MMMRDKNNNENIKGTNLIMKNVKKIKLIKNVKGMKLMMKNVKEAKLMIRE
jgi:hypothetical protein